MLSLSFSGLLVFLAALLFMYLVVPMEKIRGLLGPGLVFGAGLAFILVYLMQNYYKTWIFQGVDLVYFFHIPLFLSFAWTPLIISFSFLMMQDWNTMKKIAVFLLFPTGAVMLHYILLMKGGLIYYNWRLLWTFLLSAGIHLGILVYIFSIKNRLKE